MLSGLQNQGWDSSTLTEKLRGYLPKSTPLVWALRRWRNSGTSRVQTELWLTFGRGSHSFYPFWTDYPAMTICLRLRRTPCSGSCPKSPPKPTNRTRNGHSDPQAMNKLLHNLPQAMTHALLVCPVTLSLLLVLFQCVENHSH